MLVSIKVRQWRHTHTYNHSTREVETGNDTTGRDRNISWEKTGAQVLV